MKRSLFLALVLIIASAVPAMAQGGGQVVGTQCWINGQLVGGFPAGYQCPAPSGGSNPASTSPTANPAVYNGFYQLGYQFGRWLFGGSSNPQAEAQEEALKQQMMLELQRRQAEAERLHQEEEARRLAAIYNRLYATLKLSGLPDLHLKNIPSNGPGLSLKLGDSADGQAGIKGLPGIYLNDSKVPYGIPGLPGIYTGGPGQGSGLTNSKLALKTGESEDGATQAASPATGLNQGGQSSAAPTGDTSAGSSAALTDESKLQLKTGESNTASAAQPITLDPSKMTPQQLADVAEMVSRLPPEEQQRLLAATKKDAASAPSSSSVLTPQTATQPVASLQQQANASQTAAAAPVPEDASSKARGGFDTPLGQGATQPVIAATSNKPPSASWQAPASGATASSSRPSTTPFAAAESSSVQPPTAPFSALATKRNPDQIRAEIKGIQEALERLNRSMSLDASQRTEWEQESAAATRDAWELGEHMAVEVLTNMLDKRLKDVQDKLGNEAVLLSGNPSPDIKASLETEFKRLEQAKAQLGLATARLDRADKMVGVVEQADAWTEGDLRSWKETLEKTYDTCAIFAPRVRARRRQ